MYLGNKQLKKAEKNSPLPPSKKKQPWQQTETTTNVQQQFNT